MRHSYYCLSLETTNLTCFHNITKMKIYANCSLVEQVVGDSAEENNFGSH